MFHEIYLGNYVYMFSVEGVFTYITCCSFQNRGQKIHMKEAALEPEELGYANNAFLA